jgi:DNA repair protein RadA/Sms
MEGLRPLLIEVQALVSSAVYGTPQRSSTGFNSKRLNMLLAVLEKRAGFALGAKDVFINVTGGLTIEDPATDLCVVAAILSSYHDLPLPEGICFAAEIGLSGEIRPVPKIEQRIFEAQKLGFQEIVVSKFSKSTPQDTTIKVLPFSNVKAVVEYLFG